MPDNIFQLVYGVVMVILGAGGYKWLDRILKFNLENKKETFSENKDGYQTALELMQKQIDRLERELEKEKEMARDNARKFEKVITSQNERIRVLENVIMANNLGHLIEPE